MCHLPGQRLDAILANQWKIRVRMNPRHNWTMPISRFIVEDGEIFLRTDAVGRDNAHPLRWKSERKNGRTRAPFSRVYEIRGIQFDEEFALNGSGTRSWYPDPSRVSTRSAGMCLGARLEINLNSRTRKVPALTRTSADHATFPLSIAFSLLEILCKNSGWLNLLTRFIKSHVFRD